METTGVKYKYSVITFIFGNYEKLHEITAEKEADVEYICVTDNEDLTSNTWKMVVDHDLDGKGAFDKCFSVRYNPYKYVNSDICVRIDGSIELKKSITPLVEKFIESGCDACFMLHPYRDNIITEYNTWIQYRQFPLTIAQKHVDFLQRLGYDFNKKGLIELGFSICKKNKINEDINRIMYSTMKYLGTEADADRLDQTIITAILDKYFPDINIFFVGEDNIHSPYMQWYAHNSDNPVTYIRELLLRPHFFGKEIETYSL